MRRPPYAPTYRVCDGYQSAYDAGLSYFPDSPFLAPTPMGDIATDLAAAGGTAIAGPVGGAVAAETTSVISRWFGGSAVDQQRQDRVNYFAQLAANGNVAAMQLILGGPANVSGNESTMWQTAYTLVRQANPAVVAAAEALGPVWLVNSGDTATNYPRMRQFAQTWAAQNPLTTAANSAQSFIGSLFSPAPVTTSPGGVPLPQRGSVSPVVLLGGAAVVAFVVFGRRRRS